MKRLLPHSIEPSATNGEILTTVAGKAAWGAAPAGGLDAEAVRDTIAAALVAGSNMTITVDDAGDTITLASTGGGGGGTPTYVGAKVYRSAAYSLVANAATAMPWDAEEWDTDGFHDNVTNNHRLTVPTGQAGKYAVSANIATDQSGTATRFMAVLRKNGVDIRGGRVEVNAVSATFPGVSVTCEVDLAVGDYVEVLYFQNGATRTFYNASCAMSMHKIG